MGGLCQVDEGFDQEHIGVEKDGNIGDKTTSGADAVTERHAAWLNRCGHAPKKSWRPRHMHRKAARQWLDFIDNQLRWMGIEEGLSYFVKKLGHQDMSVLCVCVCLYLCL